LLPLSPRRGRRASQRVLLGGDGSARRPGAARRQVGALPRGGARAARARRAAVPQERSDQRRDVLRRTGGGETRQGGPRAAGSGPQGRAGSRLPLTGQDGGETRLGVVGAQLDRSAVRAGDLFDDEEPEAEPAATRLRSALEGKKDALLVVPVEGRALVGDGDAHVVGSLRLDDDRRQGRTVGERVLEEVPDQLRDTVGVERSAQIARYLDEHVAAGMAEGDLVHDL